MKSLTNPTPIQKQGYKGVKVTSMINAVKQKEIYSHLRLVQQDEFRKLENRYNKLGYLTQPYFSYLWVLYWNFVLNDFRFEDKSKEWTEVSKIKKIESKHIGMQILEVMEQQNNCKTCGKKTDKIYCSEKCYTDND